MDRELGPLRDYDAAHGTGLTGVLAAYLAAGGNKADAAARAHLARPTLYERLRHIERILGVSLDSAESRTSLHVALLIAARAAPSPEAIGGSGQVPLPSGKSAAIPDNRRATAWPSTPVDHVSTPDG